MLGGTKKKKSGQNSKRHTSTEQTLQPPFSFCVNFVPAMRMTALSAGSSTSPEADLERLMRWCFGRFQGNVSPGDGEKLTEVRSLELSSDAALTRGLLLGLPFTSSIVWMDIVSRKGETWTYKTSQNKNRLQKVSLSFL